MAAGGELKRLSRRRRRLVRGRVVNSMQADLQAAAPGLLLITRDVANLWSNFLTCRDDFRKTREPREPAIGPIYADYIQAWQNDACFGHDARLVGDMIRQDAMRILELNRTSRHWKSRRRASPSANRPSPVNSLPSTGYGGCSAELAGEIGSCTIRARQAWPCISAWPSLDVPASTRELNRRPSMATLRAKGAMMIAVDHHRKRVPQSQRYYEKKRCTKANCTIKPIRALGRHLCRSSSRCSPKSDPTDRSLTKSSKLEFPSSKLTAGCS